MICGLLKGSFILLFFKMFNKPFNVACTWLGMRDTIKCRANKREAKSRDDQNKHILIKK